MRNSAKRSSQLDDLSFRTVSFGVGDGEFCAAQGAGYGEGVGHVVAVADVGDSGAFDRTELLAYGHEVGEGLARMVGVRESVYYGDVGCAGELFEITVVEGADHDGVDVAGEDAARVGRSLAFADLDLLWTQVERVAAELVHPYLERDAGPVGWFLEDHRERTPAQRPVRDAALLQRLYANGLVQDQGHLLWGELSKRQAVAAREGGRGRRSVLEVRNHHAHATAASGTVSSTVW